MDISDVSVDAFLSDIDDPAIADTMRTLDGDDAIRCVVVRGAADTFSAGADISEFEQVRSNVAQAKIYGAVEHAAVSAVAGCRHPTVALIQGACVGGGLEIASACDVRCSPPLRPEQPARTSRRIPQNGCG